jgi:hypothetical protein
MEVLVQLVRLAAVAAASLMFCGIAVAQTDDSIGSAQAPAGERAGDHWTPEAMSAAAETPKPNVDPSTIKLPPGSGRSGMNPGALPSEVSKAASDMKHERAAGDVNTVPLIFAGKMFFSKPDGDFMCSAQFISKDVVLTAAHCVRDDKTGDFWKNITFFLQYDQGKASAKYTQKCVATFNGWVQEGNEKYLSDFAMYLVNDSKTGWFGTQWDWEGYKERHQDRLPRRRIGGWGDPGRGRADRGRRGPRRTPPRRSQRAGWLERRRLDRRL